MRLSRLGLSGYTLWRRLYTGLAPVADPMYLWKPTVPGDAPVSLLNNAPLILMHSYPGFVDYGKDSSRDSQALGNPGVTVILNSVLQ